MCQGMSGCHSILSERIGKLLESSEYSDCSFVVDGITIKAHRLILGISSPVFKAMFYGPFAVHEDIVITDIEPESFKLLLDFIYTDQIIFTSINECCSILYAAKKYIIEGLIDICIKYIKNSLSIDDVVQVFNFAYFIQEEKLWKICLTLICDHATVVLERDAPFLNIDCLKLILSQDNINANEIDIIKAVNEWLDHYIAENELSRTKEIKLELLEKNDLVSLLRFHTLGTEEWKIIEQSLLDVDVFKKKHFEKYVEQNLDTKKEPFTTKQRSFYNLHWNIARRDLFRTLPPLVIDSNKSSIKTFIKTDKTVFVNGFLIPTRMSPRILYGTLQNKYKENIFVSIHPMKNHLHESLSFICNDEVSYDSVTLLKFPKAFIFEKEEFYVASFSWLDISKPHDYTVCSRNVTSQHIATFNFIDTVKDMYNCSFIEGISFRI